MIRGIDRILADVAKDADVRQRPTLVLEFWAPEDPSEGSGSEFERCLALARYLASSRFDQVRTVTYLPRSVWGHAVLPVMACEQIVMHPDAELGNAGINETTVSPSLLGFYREIATRRSTLPAALSLGMLDRDLVVMKVTTDAGIRIELEDRIDKLRQTVNIQAIDTLIPRGDLGHFNGRTLRLDLGVVSHLATDRKELAAALEVRASLLEPDPSLGAAWVPIRVDLDGIVTSMVLALFNPNLELHRYQLAERGVTEIWTVEEWQAQPDPERWNEGEVVSPRGAYLKVRAENAESLAAVDLVAESFEDLKVAYQLEQDPRLVQPNWADDFVEFLASPQIAVVLLFFAGFALMAELSCPGMGIGGFVSAVCFMLFFWSQFLHGTASWLEILLFVTGLSCVAIEIFLIPGIGIFGVGGGVLMLASLVLASQTFILPRNDYQLEQLPHSLLRVLGAIAGIGAGIVILRKMFDKAPFFRNLALPPLDEAARHALEVYELDPMVCPEWGGQMTVVAFIEPPQADVIEKILKHCGLWQAASARPPPAGAEGDREEMACRSPRELQELTYVHQDIFEATF